MKKLTGFALIPLWVCVTSAYAEEDFSMDAEFSLSQDDNLNRTILSSHEVKDTFATANTAYIRPYVSVRLISFATVPTLNTNTLITSVA